jgi:uncharacterized circularly permuted ATP-grasp superfamily protein
MTEMIVSATATLTLAPTLNIAHACGFELAAGRDDAFFISAQRKKTPSGALADSCICRFV